MAYKSPIELICDDIQYKMEQATGQAIVKAVQHYFPLVNEEELAKALKYDRDQYEAGFLDGWKERDAEIVRCKDCKYAHLTYHGECKQCDKWLDDDDFHLTLYLNGDFYCASGERKEAEDE